LKAKSIWNNAAEEDKENEPPVLRAQHPSQENGEAIHGSSNLGWPPESVKPPVGIFVC
jgi:hypothetical protein